MIRKFIKTLLLAICASLAPHYASADASAGCGSGGMSSGIYTIQHDGITRSYRLHVPKNHDHSQPAPLVALFHGWGGDENEFVGSKSIQRLADQRGYLLVAPRGLGSGSPDNANNSWSFSGSTTGIDGNGDAICDDTITPDYTYASCSNGVAQNTCSWTQCQVDDVDFVATLVNSMKQSLCIETDKMFAFGGSNGGMFAWELAQNPQTAPLFRAIAPVIGLPHRGYLDAQGKVADLPALVITGTRDNVVPPGDWEDDSYTTTSNGNDRFYYTGATAITQSWANAHGCDTGSDAAEFDVGVRKADCRTYCTGDAGWPRVLDCRARMGHQYPAWGWGLALDFFDAHSNP